MLDIRAEGLGEGQGPVAVLVVRQDPLNRDSLGPEPGIGALPERCCGFLSLVGKDLGIGRRE